MADEDLKAQARQFRQVKIEHPGFRLEYGLMMLMATAQARAAGFRSVTALEFGVYRGDGLGAMCNIAEIIGNLCGMEFKIFGFDIGSGMPPVEGYRDHPEIWQTGVFQVPDLNEVTRGLPGNCELIVGDLRETVPAFDLADVCRDSPLGFVAVDCDLYSSTVSALEIFERDRDLYVPAVMTYFDDVDDIVTMNSWCGEALAIREFNYRNPMRKIERKNPHLHGHHCCHILDHKIRNNEWPRPTGSFDIRYKEY